MFNGKIIEVTMEYWKVKNLGANLWWLQTDSMSYSMNPLYKHILRSRFDCNHSFCASLSFNIADLLSFMYPKLLSTVVLQ